MFFQTPAFDIYLLTLINQQLKNPFFDSIMPVISNPAILYALLLPLLIWTWRKYGKKQIILVLGPGTSSRRGDGGLGNQPRQKIHQTRPSPQRLAQRLFSGKRAMGPASLRLCTNQRARHLLPFCPCGQHHVHRLAGHGLLAEAEKMASAAAAAGGVFQDISRQALPPGCHCRLALRPGHRRNGLAALELCGRTFDRRSEKQKLVVRHDSGGFLAVTAICEHSQPAGGYE